jgi:Hemerythrin HHE cation binding domain
MDSVPSASALTGLVSTSSAAPDAGSNEIGELILAEHARILRLFGVLYDLARRADPSVSRLALAQVWTRLADLLVTHTRAEEEICFPPMYSADVRILTVVEAAADDHIGIRESVAQARLLEVGSARWWQVITGARMACASHFASEERGLLSALCSGLLPGTGKVLVRQWAAFAVAPADGSPAMVSGEASPARGTGPPPA